MHWDRGQGTLGGWILSNHVTFVTPTLNPLGKAGQLPLWTETLQSAGWRVSVVSLRDRPDPRVAVRYPNTELHCFGLRAREWSRWRELKSLVSGLRTDVLHLWDCPGKVQWWLGGIAPRLALTEFERPLPASRWRRRDAGQPAMVLAFDPTLAVAANSQPALQSAAAAVATAPQVQTVLKAVPQTLERPDQTRRRLLHELELPEDSQLIVAAAELTPDTHCKDLIWGIDQLRIIRDDVHLLLLGSGRQRSRLERFLGLTEAIPATHFLGDRGDGPEIVAAADIFWQADLTTYLPDGLLVALASGVPVVSAYGPATSSAVWPQQTAWVADTSARYHYARWSKFFLEESERAAQLASQASEQTVRSFSLAAASARIREVYSELVSLG